MGTNRRNFLKQTLVGAGLMVPGFTGYTATLPTETKGSKEQNQSAQKFNMSVTLPQTGAGSNWLCRLGNRGPGAVDRMSLIDGVEIVGLCDQYPDRVEKMKLLLEKRGLPKAQSYSGSKEAWKAMCENPQIDLIYITTPWAWHTPMAVYAMNMANMPYQRCRLPKP